MLHPSARKHFIHTGRFHGIASARFGFVPGMRAEGDRSVASVHEKKSPPECSTAHGILSSKRQAFETNWRFPKSRFPEGSYGVHRYRSRIRWLSSSHRELSSLVVVFTFTGSRMLDEDLSPPFSIPFNRDVRTIRKERGTRFHPTSKKETHLFPNPPSILSVFPQPERKPHRHRDLRLPCSRSFSKDVSMRICTSIRSPFPRRDPGRPISQSERSPGVRIRTDNRPTRSSDSTVPEEEFLSPSVPSSALDADEILQHADRPFVPSFAVVSFDPIPPIVHVPQRQTFRG